MSRVAYSYFEGLVFFFFGVLILLVIMVSMSLGVLLIIVFIICALGGPILGWVIPFFRSHIDNRYVDCDVMDIYYLNFLIGAIFNKMALLSVL